jgi:glucan phosphorylase
LSGRTSYLGADQRLVGLHAVRDDWARKAILNVASSGKFSSDRTIAEYAESFKDQDHLSTIVSEAQKIVDNALKTSARGPR